MTIASSTARPAPDATDIAAPNARETASGSISSCCQRRHLRRVTGPDHTERMAGDSVSIRHAAPHGCPECGATTSRCGRSRRVADGISDAIRYAGSTALRGVVVWSGTGAGRQRGGSSGIARSRHGSVHGDHGSRPAGGRVEVHGTSFDVLSVPHRDVGGSARRRTDPQRERVDGAWRSRTVR